MRRPSMPLALLAALTLALPACAQGGFADAGMPQMDASARDSGARDAGRDARVAMLDAGRDAGPRDGGSLDAAAMDAGSVDAGPRDAGRDGGRDAGPPDAFVPGACPPSSANVAISEVMVRSQSGAGDLGEWFEVKNLSSCTVNLAGLLIEVGTASHTVASGLLTAGGSFVFAQSPNMTSNHGLDFDYSYEGSGIQFPNMDSSLTLRFETVVVDSVSWTSTSFRTGASRELNRTTTDGGGSIGSSAWCDGTAIYSSAAGGPFLGTPGMVNAICP